MAANTPILFTYSTYTVTTLCSSTSHGNFDLSICTSIQLVQFFLLHQQSCCVLVNSKLSKCSSPQATDRHASHNQQWRLHQQCQPHTPMHFKRKFCFASLP
eukprot:1161205-Pelagomonas_calceolata.AAC.8